MPCSRLTGQSAKVPAQRFGGYRRTTGRPQAGATRETQATMRTRTVGVLSAIALVVGAAGCGSSDSYDNAARPPAPVNLAVNLSSERVAISPSRIGAGPVVLLVANESGRSRELTLTAPAGSDSSCVDGDVSSGPINPQGTARLQLPLVEGRCEVGVADGSLQPVRLTVGPPRPSAQQDLLQP